MKKTNYYIMGIILLILVTSCSSSNISKKDINKVKNTSYDDVVKNLSTIIFYIIMIIILFLIWNL